MYAPRVFISMMCALLVFAVATYIIRGSILASFVQTLICLVIIQVGYFIGVVLLVVKEKRLMNASHGYKKDASPSAEKQVAEKIPAVPTHTPKLRDF